jgi:hypothetical protein
MLRGDSREASLPFRLHPANGIRSVSGTGLRSARSVAITQSDHSSSSLVGLARRVTRYDIVPEKHNQKLAYSKLHIALCATCPGYN